MIHNDFQPGNSIGVEISTGSHPGLYIAKVEVAREDIIGTTVPVFQGRMARLSKGDKVALVPNGDAAAERFSTSVANFFPTPISLYIFQNPHCDFGVDKRVWPRVDVELPMEYFSLEADKRSFVEAVAANISGGGLLLNTKKSMRPGERLIVKLGLDQFGDVSATCQVIRCMEKEKPDGTHHFCGVNFIDINDADRKKILDFVSKQMKK